MNIRDRLQSPSALALLYWLVLVVALCAPYLDGRQIVSGGDNGMRLLEAQDLFNGQSWWDTTQYRDNVPFGGPMHWSRLIDGPIALLIALFTPFLGGQAPMAASVVWPMLTLLGLAFALVALASRMMDRPGPLVVMLITALSMPIYQDFRPGRVDHHNVQSVLALVAIYCAINARASLLWSVLAGVATATIVAIGAEGLPMVVAALIVVPLYWVMEPGQNWRPLLGFGASFAVGTLLHLLLVTPPSQWLVEHCDALSYTYVTAASAYAVFIGASVGAGRWLGKPWQRLAVLALGGGLAVATTLALNPDCIGGPYGNLPRDLAAILLDPLPEAHPITIWLDPPQPHLSLMIVPIAGLIATALAAYYDRPRRVAWLVLLAFVLTALLTTILQIRGIRLVTLVVLPAGAWAIIQAWGYLRRSQSLKGAAVAAFVCLAFMNGLHWVLAWTLFPATPASGAVQHDRTYADCVKPENFKHLQSLPTGRIVTFLHFGPSVLMQTHHSIVVAGYHRNIEGLRAAIDFFSGDEQRALAVARDRKLDYLAFCNGISPEYGLGGLPPFKGTEWNWLTRLTTPDEPIQIYALHPDAAGAGEANPL